MKLLHSSHIRVLALIMPCCLLGACASSEPVVTRGAPPAFPAQASVDPAAWLQDSTPSMLRSADRISVIVAREPDLSLTDVRVGEDGFFEMPYVGRIEAAGHTPSEVAAAVRTRLIDSYMHDPRVSVNVLEFGSHTVTIEGAVSKPGIFQYQKGTTLLGAIALAEGPTRAAKLKQVAVFRKLDTARAVAVFDLHDVRAGKLVDPVLQPGDLVVVGFSGLAQGWQDFLMAAPVIGIFSRF